MRTLRWLMVALLAVLTCALRGQAQPSISNELSVAGLPPRPPLAVTASHDGMQLDIVVDLKPSWHLYGRDTGGGEPVTVEITGGAFTASGALSIPMDEKGEVTGRATLHLPLRRIAAGNELRARLHFMVCDALECLPPITLTLTTAATKADPPIKVLLVAVDKEERTQRIEAFLKTRGFDTAVTTYADLRAEDCDRAEVVLADSPTFRLTKGQLPNVRKFPATTTPVIAVGFLGTELLKAQKVAMTSGYI